MRDKIVLVTLTRTAATADDAESNRRLASELQRIFEAAEQDSEWKVEKITVLEDQ